MYGKVNPKAFGLNRGKKRIVVLRTSGAIVGECCRYVSLSCDVCLGIVWVLWVSAADLCHYHTFCLGIVLVLWVSAADLCHDHVMFVWVLWVPLVCGGKREGVLHL